MVYLSKITSETRACPLPGVEPSSGVPPLGGVGLSPGSANARSPPKREEGGRRLRLLRIPHANTGLRPRRHPGPSVSPTFDRLAVGSSFAKAAPTPKNKAGPHLMREPALRCSSSLGSSAEPRLENLPSSVPWAQSGQPYRSGTCVLPAISSLELEKPGPPQAGFLLVLLLRELGVSPLGVGPLPGAGPLRAPLALRSPAEIASHPPRP